MAAALDTAGLLDELRDRIESAPRRSRRTLLSATAPVRVADPAAAVFSARLAGDSWFCWEQPDRDFALAALGTAAEATSRGDRRFADVAERCLEVMRGAEATSPVGLPAAAGPVWTGGFAFAPEGGSASTWSSFAPASMTLPELSLVRHGDVTFVTFNALLGPGEDAERGARAGWRRGWPGCAPRRCRCSTRTGSTPRDLERPSRRVISSARSRPPWSGSAPAI